MSEEEDNYTKGFMHGTSALSKILIDDIFRNCSQDAQIAILRHIKIIYEDLYMQVAKVD